MCKCNLTLWNSSYDHQGYGKKTMYKIQAYDTSETLWSSTGAEPLVQPCKGQFHKLFNDFGLELIADWCRTAGTAM